MINKDRMKEGTPLMHFLKPLAEKKQKEQADRMIRVLGQYNALTELLQRGGGMPQAGMPQTGMQPGGMQGGMRRGV